MSKLSSSDRKSLPASAFALPGERAYPVEDKGHAIAAKARASEMEHKGVISKSTKAKIDTAANREIGKSDQSGHWSKK